MVGKKDSKLLISNNSLVLNKLAANKNLRLLREDTLKQVFIKTRDLIHQNARLLTHPLMGSIEPKRNPYRTILLDDFNQEFDLQSLQMIETILHKYRGCWPEVRDYNGQPDLLKDLKKLDYELIQHSAEKVNFCE